MTTEIQAIDFESALKRIVQTSNADSLLAKGIHEVSKALESKDEKVRAKYVILAKNCTEANYVKIIKGLAAQNKVPFRLFRPLFTRSRLQKPLASGSASASWIRTETLPKRENARLWQLGTSPTTSRKNKGKSFWLGSQFDCI